MKKNFVPTVTASIVFVGAAILLLVRCPAELPPVCWQVEKEQPKLIERKESPNRLESVLFLNEMYQNYRYFSGKTSTLVDTYEIDLTSTAVIRGNVEKKKERIEVKGNNVVIGLLQVGHLLHEKKLDVLTMTVSTRRDINIKVFESDMEIGPALRQQKTATGNYQDPAHRFIFLGKISGSQSREQVDIELRNYGVKQRDSRKHLLFSIDGSPGEGMDAVIHGIYLKSHQSRIIGTYPAVNYFKTKEKWQKSLFIPGSCSLSYLIHADRPFCFTGSLGAFPGETPEYEIKADGISLLSCRGSQEFSHFSLTVTPVRGKTLLEISVKSPGQESASGVLGNCAFFYQKEEAAHIVFYLIDALRRDYGGLGEKERANLFEKYFSGGAVFESAYANATWTGDSLPVIFSGRYKFSLVNQPQDHPNLPDEEFLLAEYLKTRGYTTAAFITNSFLVKDNAAQGFDEVFLCWGKGRGLPPFPTEQEYSDFKYGNMERYLREFVEKNRDRKLFLFIHTVETHDPYELPENLRHYSANMDREILKSVNGRFKERLTSPYPEQVAALKALYRDEVHSAYRFFAKIEAQLAEEKILRKKSLLLLTADHGERFFEHGSWLHAEPDVYNEVLAIPMMIKGPGFPTGRFPANVQLADIFPTIMEWLGDQKRKGMVGDPLQRLYKSEAAEYFKNRIIYADGAKHPQQYSLIIDSLKIIVNGGHTEVYDLKDDPGETKNLAARAEFASLVRMARSFRDKLQAGSKRKRETINAEEMERLKSLGYLD